MLESWLHLVFK